ncbi:hypothetical protein BASA81_003188 [Batrachochytrium salamandrivorans]|nr:hypothetical protein BASA81_003188 [Batrachochytrium salamandrivorans]
MLAAYANASARRPLLTNVGVGLGVMFFGDLASQTVLEGKSIANVDKVRLVRSSLWNGLVISPTFLVWFRYLDRVFPNQVIKKTLVNQLIMPVPTGAGFLLYSTLANDLAVGGLQGLETSLNTVKHRIYNDLPTLVATSALFWFPVNCLNFALVPAKYRVLPSVCGGVIWGSFLTFIGHRNLPTPAME